MDGQTLKTRSIARLVKENQLNVEEFKMFKIATHESNANYQESSHDQMLFKDLVQKALLQQNNNSSMSMESESQVVHSSGLTPESMASSAEGVTFRIIVNKCSDSASSRTTLTQQSEDESQESKPHQNLRSPWSTHSSKVS